VGKLDTVLPSLQAHYQKKARLVWWCLLAAATLAVLLGVVAFLALEVISGWASIFQAQSQQIDRLSQ
jgi:hypothetical protein